MNKGDTNNYLTMVSDALPGCRKHYPKALFRCVCGTVKEIGIKNVSEGATKSCGCKRKELNRTALHNYKHGSYGTRLYNIYHKMKSRCLNPNYPETRYYKSRGITICNEWLDDFKAFKKWSLENGYADNLTIDRIDVNKGYSPDNCRWITQKEQNRNKRNNILIEHNGEIKTLMDWCIELNLKYGTIEMRIKRGWDKEKALITPIKSCKQGKGVWRKINTDYFCY